MKSQIEKLLGLSVSERNELSKTAGTIKSVAEFLSDLSTAVKDTDFITRITECMPWWLQATGESIAEAAPPIKFLATLLGKLGQINDPNKLAFLAFTTAYQRAVEKSLRVVGSPKKPERRTKWAVPDELELSIDDMDFNKYSLKDPLNHQFIKKANELLNNAMAAAGYDNDECRIIQAEVQMRFPGSLKAILTHPVTRERFMPLSNMLIYDNAEERVYAAWQDHFEYLRYLFEDKPVFGEEPFSLSDIYVESECGVTAYDELIKSDKIQSHNNKEHAAPSSEDVGGRHDMMESVLNLLGDPYFKDAIIIQGPAGSGKSTFTLKLAVELIRKGLKPIRIRFRDLALNFTNVEDALPEAVRFWDTDQRRDEYPNVKPDELFLNSTLFEQKVKFGNAEISPWVVILDGWDEVSIAVQKGFAVRMGEILSQIRDRFLSRGNRHPIRVILTGRPSDAVSGSSFLRKQTMFLTIRPLDPMHLEPFLLSLAKKLIDPRKASYADPSRYKKVLENYADGFNTYLHGDEYGRGNKNSAMQVLGLPLLAHLAVRLMVRWPHDDLTPIVENPTTLYRLLTDMTCGKGGRYGNDVYDPMIDQSDLRGLLHETAVAMTTFGKDNIPYEELDFRLSQLNENLVDRVQNATKDYPITSLMINFFFKNGRKELGAEFLHKSFREFLYAEAIIESLKDYGYKSSSHVLQKRDPERYWREFDPTDLRYELSRRLGQILAPQWISKEIASFLEGLIAWELSRTYTKHDEDVNAAYSTPPLGFDGWERIRDGLADLWEWWGDGVHLRQQPLMSGKKIVKWEPPFVQELISWSMPQYEIQGEVQAPPRTVTIDAHLGDALFRLNALVHHYVSVKPGEDLNWKDFDCYDVQEGRVYQSVWRCGNERKVRFKPSGVNDNYFYYYMARINAAGWHPGQVFPSSIFMKSIDLRECFLALAGFAKCDLEGADFSFADLISAYFSDANLNDAIFTGSSLYCANFVSCDVQGTIFKRVRNPISYGPTIINTDLSNAEVVEIDGIDKRTGNKTGYLPQKSNWNSIYNKRD